MGSSKFSLQDIASSSHYYARTRGYIGVQLMRPLPTSSLQPCNWEHYFSKPIWCMVRLSIFANLHKVDPEKFLNESDNLHLEVNHDQFGYHWGGIIVSTSFFYYRLCVELCLGRLVSPKNNVSAIPTETDLDRGFSRETSFNLQLIRQKF